MSYIFLSVGIAGAILWIACKIIFKINNRMTEKEIKSTNSGSLIHALYDSKWKFYHSMYRSEFFFFICEVIGLQSYIIMNLLASLPIWVASEVILVPIMLFQYRTLYDSSKDKNDDYSNNNQEHDKKKKHKNSKKKNKKKKDKKKSKKRRKEINYASMYGIKSNFTVEELKQYKNSWFFLSQIDIILGGKYLNIKDTHKMMLSLSDLRKLERKVSKAKITEDCILWLLEHQQIFFTKDKEFIADCIQKFLMGNIRYYHPDNSNLIEFYNEIRRDILKLDENEHPYFAFNITSDTFEDIPVSLKEKDEDVVDFVYIENGKIKKLISNLKI